MIYITDLDAMLFRGKVIPEVEKDFAKMKDSDEIIVVIPDRGVSMNLDIFDLLKATKATVSFNECKSVLDVAFLCGKYAEKAGNGLKITLKNKEYQAVADSLVSGKSTTKTSTGKAKTAKSTAKAAKTAVVGASAKAGRAAKNAASSAAKSTKAAATSATKTAKNAASSVAGKVTGRKGRPPKAVTDGTEPVNTADNAENTADNTSAETSEPVKTTRRGRKPAADKTSTNGKRPSMDEIRAFFKKYDTKEFKMSSSAATIWDAFKQHLTGGVEIEESLKNVLLVDDKVKAVMDIISDNKVYKEIEAYVKKAI